MAGSSDIHATVGLAIDEMRMLLDTAARWSEVATAAEAALSEVTTATSREEPGVALDALRAARDRADRFADLLVAGIERGNEYLSGV
jgi:hypothetical protein